MIVRLTNRQHRRVCDVMEAEMDERFMDQTAEWLSEDVEQASKQRVDVAMPAIAWKRVWDVMFDHCYNNRGMRARGVRTTDMNALKSIRHSLNAREMHPALSGVSAIGMIGEVIPVWMDLLGGGWSPYPIAGTFKIMMPQHRTLSGQRVTTWVTSDKHPDRKILREHEHLRFVIG